MIVLKFGGTSVGTAKSIKKVVKIITDITQPKIVVLSAVSGTTNILVNVCNNLENNLIDNALLDIKQLNNKYLDLINNLYKTSSYKSKAVNFISLKFNELAKLIETKKSSNVEKIIVAQGEILSTNLVQLYLEESNISSTLISALDFIKIDKKGEPDIKTISEKLSPILENDSQENLWITQGFICVNDAGEIDNLQRGGSDYTASLIAGAIKAKEVQIWTDINGMHNNDPRFVRNTFSIEEISFDEAAELAYFGAKILHPQSLIPAKENNIPVLLKNTFSPQQKGTVIKNKTAQNGGVTAIAAKDGIIAIKIKSYRMLLAYGFLKKVFEVFEKYKTPIDMITTSEVAISLTIDNMLYLSEITKELQNFGKVTIDTGLSIVCVAGDFSQNKEGISAEVFSALKNIPIRMISYGGSNYNISLLIKTSDKIPALNSLNAGLFSMINS